MENNSSASMSLEEKLQIGRVFDELERYDKLDFQLLQVTLVVTEISKTL